jgi:hypothetical protein
MSVRTLNYRPAPEPTIGVNMTAHSKKATLPKEFLPVRTLADVGPKMKAAPKLSKATKFARDFLEEKKRMELLDVYKEKLSQQLNTNSGYEQQVGTNTFVTAALQQPKEKAINIIPTLHGDNDPAKPPPAPTLPPQPKPIDPEDIVDSPHLPEPPTPPKQGPPAALENPAMELDPPLQQIVTNYYNTHHHNQLHNFNTFNYHNLHQNAYLNHNYNQNNLTQSYNQNNLTQNAYLTQNNLTQNAFVNQNSLYQNNVSTNNTVNALVNGVPNTRRAVQPLLEISDEPQLGRITDEVPMVVAVGGPSRPSVMVTSPGSSRRLSPYNRPQIGRSSPTDALASTSDALTIIQKPHDPSRVKGKKRA